MVSAVFFIGCGGGDSSNPVAATTTGSAPIFSALRVTDNTTGTTADLYPSPTIVLTAGKSYTFAGNVTDVDGDIIGTGYNDWQVVGDPTDKGTAT